MAWVSFCISTYKRPQFIHKQIDSLLNQSFGDFEIVVSDNDPDASAKLVVEAFKDSRVKYYQNQQNVGMVKSFTKSIERASGEFVAMVTDDDPIDEDFLEEMNALYKNHPGYSIYCGFLRPYSAPGAIEVIDKESFLTEILDTQRTKDFIWSSCIMHREVALKIGGMPDYGSPSLADGAMVALVGAERGGVIVNKVFSRMTSHDGNFTKHNMVLFSTAVKGFYNCFRTYTERDDQQAKKNKEKVVDYLGHWFLLNYFFYKKHFTIKVSNKEYVAQLDNAAAEVFALPYMEPFKNKFARLNSRFKMLVPFFKVRNLIKKYEL